MGKARAPMTLPALALELMSPPASAEIEIRCDIEVSVSSLDSTETRFPDPITLFQSNRSPRHVEREKHESVFEIVGREGARNFVVIDPGSPIHSTIFTILPDGKAVRTTHWAEATNTNGLPFSTSDIGTCEVIE